MSTRRRHSSEPGLGQPAGRLAGDKHPNPEPRLDEADRPAPDVHCASCSSEIPQEARHSREIDDYRLWFCSPACREQWDGERARE